MRLGELRQRLGEQVVEHRSGGEGEDRLAERARVRGQLRADLEDLERRVGPEDVVDDDDASAPCSTPTRTAAPVRAASRSACTIERAAQLVEVEVGVAELQQARAELVLVGVAVLLDEAVGLKRLQQPVHGRARQARAGRRAR